VVAKVRESLAVSKRASQKFEWEIFILRKPNEMEVRKQCQTEITNRCVALENLSVGKDINRAWENTKENIKTSAKECLCLHEEKEHKPWFDEECLGFLDQRKRAKMQCIHDPRKSHVNNLNDERHDLADIERTKRRNIWKLKIRNLKQRVGSKISGTCAEASLTLRRVTSLERI